MNLEEPESRELDVKLSEEEVHSKAEILARVIDETRSVEEEKAKAVRSFSGKLKDLRRRTDELARNITKREEMRPVMCYPRADLRRFVVETIRGDNGQVIDSRAMTKDELEEARQGQLFDQNHPGGEAHTKKRIASGPPVTESPAAWNAPDVSDVKAEPGEKMSAMIAKHLVDDGGKDPTSITNPEDLLNGKEAKAAAKREAKDERDRQKPKRQKRPGLNVGAPGEEMPPVTPTTALGAALIAHAETASAVGARCQAEALIKQDVVACSRPAHLGDADHVGSNGDTWTDASDEAISDGVGETVSGTKGDASP